MSEPEKSVDALGMSDEDFTSLDMSVTFPEKEITNEEKVQQNEEETEQPEEQPEVSEVEEAPEGADEDGVDATDALEAEKNTEDIYEDNEESVEETDIELFEDDNEKEEETSEEETEKDSAVIAQEFMNKITSKFRANGRDMQVTDPDDIVRLMQMGANYNKKMAAMKPALKVMKMLERNELLDENKISYLIDLDKKDPTAIAKLVKDSEIDPMEMDLDEASKYKTSRKYAVDDKEIALDEVVEEIRETPTYSKTLDIVSSKWDGESRSIVANTPELMRVINDHMQSGIYDVISTEVDKERTLGRLNGISDIEAYKRIGDALDNKGAFNHLFTQETKKPVVKPPAPKQVSPENRKAKRRAASPTKTAPKTPQKDFNPLSLSDEEFMKQTDDRFL